jgi:DNA-binding GntR family transcriptional regulator
MNMSVLRPVQKRSAESHATDALRESIVSGAIKPGSRLTEVKLAEQLALSRATIRTALHQLSQEGLILQIPYTGWIVMSLSAQDAWELYTLRSSLEALAARLAAERLTEIGRKSLKKSFDALRAACKKKDRKQIADADFGLHRTIIELAGHRMLAEQYRLVEQQVRLYIFSSDELVPDTAAIIAQHRPIVDAIISGEVVKASELSQNHNTSEGEILVAHLKRIAAC